MDCLPVLLAGMMCPWARIFCLNLGLKYNYIPFSEWSLSSAIAGWKSLICYLEFQDVSDKRLAWIPEEFIDICAFWVITDYEAQKTQSKCIFIFFIFSFIYSFLIQYIFTVVSTSSSPSNFPQSSFPRVHCSFFSCHKIEGLQGISKKPFIKMFKKTK